MRIAIVGYGRMGKEIEQILIEKNIDYVTVDSSEELQSVEADVAIDFTEPDQVVSNVRILAEKGINIVIGTTGWYDKMDEVREITNNVGCVWASNFSIGMNVFFKVVENASRMLDNFDYDSYIYELHHNKKKDSPSGTAKSLGQTVLDNSSKTKMVFDKLDREKSADELHVASVRAGNIPGTHTVGFDSNADTIELTHTARNRGGFALGAVLAAEFISGKTGFYEFKEILNDIMGGKNV